MRRLKAMGFSDKRLAFLALESAHVRPGMESAIRRGSGLIREAIVAMTGGITEAEVRKARHKLGVRPVFKRIDTCAAEFEAKTPYMYSTYEAPRFGEPECESAPTDREKIVILGGGPNRIGQGIEFDYCCVHACFALSEAGYETIMVNCNPETVSTDYDTVRPAVFRAADRRRCAGNPACREAEWHAKGRDRAIWRANTAQSGKGVGGCRNSDPRHFARRHRSCRRPRTLCRPRQQAETQTARKRHCPKPR